MSNSKAQILAGMAQRPVTRGWGAISVFGRARLNRLLEQQFVEGFNESSFLPPFSMEKIFLTDDENEWLELDQIILSKPLLSFETASLDNSEATLTLGFMAGTVRSYFKPVGRPVSLVSTFNLGEQQGYALQMKVNLSMVVGQVDRRGRVTLDLRNSLRFSCNLAEQLNAQHRIGTAFETAVKELPRHKRVFELGTLDLKGYNPLTPTTFYLRTQAAPGASNLRSSNYGEGGVLVFIALRDKPDPGSFPGEGTGFPYFIPDDQDAQGNDLYSAALVLSQDMIQHIEHDNLELLSSLLFPGENVYIESTRHIPHDLISFGNIDPTLTTITLEPLFKVIQAGATQQFHVRQAGKVLTSASVTWTVRSINSNRAAGGISADGLYTSVSPSELGKQTVRNVVTARYRDPQSGQERRASALLSVVYEPLSVSPQAGTQYITGGNPRPVKLAATTLGGGTPVWSLLAPALGNLIADGNQATYLPPINLPGTEMVVQRIQVKDSVSGQTTESSLLLMGSNPGLAVTPAHVSGVGHSAEVQLAGPADELPEDLQWSVVSGEGSVDDHGLFTAPAQLTGPTSVVRCDLIFRGQVYASGYSVINLSDYDEEPTWSRLTSFTLTAPANQVRAMRNGYQQIALVVEIKTAKVGDEYYPVTPEELSTLEIVHSSGQAEEYLPKGQQGIEGDVHYRWAVSRDENSFNRYRSAGAHDDAPYDDVTQEHTTHEARDGSRDDRVYMHTLAADPETFHARIKAHRQEFNSTDFGKEPPFTIELVPVTVPEFNAQEYRFEPRRVAGGGEVGQDRPPTQEEYDFHLVTTDYWHLEFRSSLGENVTFVRCEFDDNQSQIQWESRRTNETMFSYTGYIFNDPQGKQNPEVMHYDLRLAKLISKSLDNNIVPGRPVAEGQLMISLFRTDDVRYRSSAIATELEKTMRVDLLDKNGNLHRLSIGFKPMGLTDSRNALELSVIGPGQP